MPSCAICLSSFNSNSSSVVVSLHCGHLFHQDCLDSWFNSRPVKRCPTCRKICKVGERLVLFMQFEPADASFSEDLQNQNRQAAVATNGAAFNAGLQSANDLEILEAQLESVQIAFTEAIDVQNNLESLNLQLKQEMRSMEQTLDQSKREIVNSKRMVDRLKLRNEEVHERLTSVTAELNLCKNVEGLMKQTGGFKANLHKFKSVPRPAEETIEALVAVLTLKEAELKRKISEVKKAQQSNTKLSQENVNLKAKIRDLTKEAASQKTAKNKRDSAAKRRKGVCSSTGSEDSVDKTSGESEENEESEEDGSVVMLESGSDSSAESSPIIGSTRRRGRQSKENDQPRSMSASPAVTMHKQPAWAKTGGQKKWKGDKKVVARATRASLKPINLQTEADSERREDGTK